MRGGTTSAVLTAAAVARNKDGIYVGGMTRRNDSKRLIRRSGMNGVFFDDGHVVGQIMSKFDKVQELTETTTLWTLFAAPDLENSVSDGDGVSIYGAFSTPSVQYNVR